MCLLPATALRAACLPPRKPAFFSAPPPYVFPLLYI
jgi:hypothetical protein